MMLSEVDPTSDPDKYRFEKIECDICNSIFTETNRKTVRCLKCGNRIWFKQR